MLVIIKYNVKFMIVFLWEKGCRNYEVDIGCDKLLSLK